LFAIGCHDLADLVAASGAWQRFFDIGGSMPCNLPRFLYWRGHRADLGEVQRTELWETAALLALRMLRVDPVNNALIADDVLPCVIALHGRLPGRFGASLRDELRRSDGHSMLVIEPPSVRRRVRATIGSAVRRARSFGSELSRRRS
jgi:hypothetical protein